MLLYRFADLEYVNKMLIANLNQSNESTGGSIVSEWDNGPE